MAAKILTPVKGYSGKVAGVAFVDGEGETDDPAALNYFRQAGYTVEEAKEPAKRAPKKPEADGSAAE